MRHIEISIKSDRKDVVVFLEELKSILQDVFGKDIKGKQIYIKLKIKGEAAKKVLCVSFHYAKWKMEFPYT